MYYCVEFYTLTQPILFLYSMMYHGFLCVYKNLKIIFGFCNCFILFRNNTTEYIQYIILHILILLIVKLITLVSYIQNNGFYWLIPYGALYQDQRA